VPLARSYAFVADATSADPAALEPLLRQLLGDKISPIATGVHVVATL